MSYAEIDYTSKSKPAKRFVQTLFYRMSKVKSTTPVLLCGPDLESHLRDLKIVKHKGSYMRPLIYELDEKVFEKNKKDWNELKKDFILISPLFRNKSVETILKGRTPSFVDLDFCGRWAENKEISLKIFEKMKKGKCKKHLLLTFTQRNQTCDIYKDVCKTFGFKYNKTKIDLIPNLNLYTNELEKEYDVKLISYRDTYGPPMISISIQW